MEEKRKKLNVKLNNVNYKQNLKQQTNDISLIERNDYFYEKRAFSNLFHTAFDNESTNGVNALNHWKSSLRSFDAQGVLQNNK